MEQLRITADTLPLDPIADEAIAHVYGLWNARRGTRPMPAPGDLLPEEFGVALGRVNLLDVLREPLRFVYRVRSSVIADMNDQEMKGRDVSEMRPPEYRDMLLRHYAEAVSLGAPTFYDIKQRRNDVASEYRRMILPLGTTDVVERLMTVSAWGADFVRKAELLGFKRR